MASSLRRVGRVYCPYRRARDTDVGPRGRGDRLEPGRRRGAAVARHCVASGAGQGAVSPRTWRWSTPPSTTQSTRSSAATSPTSPRPWPSVAFAGRRRRGRRASRTRQRRARDSRYASARDRGRLRGCAPALPDGPAKAGGIATGEAAATELLAARAGDGRFGPFRFAESTLPGGWRLVPPAMMTDPGAWLKDVTRSSCATRTASAAAHPTRSTRRHMRPISTR